MCTPSVWHTIGISQKISLIILFLEVLENVWAMMAGGNPKSFLLLSAVYLMFILTDKAQKVWEADEKLVGLV
jgi:hypothetical protein